MNALKQIDPVSFCFLLYVAKLRHFDLAETLDDNVQSFPRFRFLLHLLDEVFSKLLPLVPRIVSV